MIAVRPKSFLSPIMIGVATYVYKKFGSKLLLNLLATLGFSASYDEASRLEGSYVLQAKKAVFDESANPFGQFIFDNADFNVNTLDGQGTFHAMGGIMAVTPGNAVTSETDVMRMKVPLASDLISKAGAVEIKQYTRPPNGGLKTVRLFDINISPEQNIVPSACDIAWLYGKSVHSTVLGWNGFMQMKTLGEKYECSKIVCLPFINAPPSEYSTIYTAILTALEECGLLHQKTCIVTFDQPLFWKARDVVASIPEFRNVVVRLGGFHLLMSFMGAIGTIMAGSGLKQLFSEIFAGNSVDKILSGHAYARAVRAHSLAYAALGGLIIENMELKDEDLFALDTVLDSSSQAPMGSEEPALEDVAAKFAQVLKKIEDRGPTAALWIQYFRTCALIKNFIRAERAGDWNFHLDSVREMIPYFHAAGHLNYAKSAHLYYQDMINLKDMMDSEEHEKFTTKGYFTIRRTDKFWSGIWSDMTIEQVLMRAMKSYGGLTRGRGISDNVLSRWIVGMLCLQSINEQMEVYSGVRAETTEQHVDMRPSRVARDNLDTKRFSDWLADHPPFLDIQDLLSIGTGAVAPDGVNCNIARTIGITSMKNCLEHGNFQDLKLKRKDKVVTLASVSCSLKIKNKTFTVDPLTLFQRICITKQSDADLRNLFKYELAPFPMSLFTEEGMHKGRKSMLYEAFSPIQEEVDFGNNKCAVIDGGYLLHKVVWGKSKEATFELVCTSYVDYVQRHFGSKAVVVFDGYPVDLNYQSTKAAERYRRSMLHSPTKFVFSKTTPCGTILQAKFLASDTNKKNFITLLMSEMEAKGIQVMQATEDADVLIVQTAISQAGDFDSVIITGEDVDLLVLLTALGTSKKNIYYQKSGRGNIPCALYSSHSCKFNPQDILFLHAITGCDTTSAPFGIGKKKVMQVYDKNPWLSDTVSIFKDPDATPHQIFEAGEKFLVKLYGGTVDIDNLDDLRYRTFSTVVAKPKLQLARLPPTRDAAKYHCYRTYLQLQTWLGSEGTQRKLPSAWGWNLTKQGDRSQVSASLVQAAKSLGSKDNISVVVAWLDMSTLENGHFPESRDAMDATEDILLPPVLRSLKPALQPTIAAAPKRLDKSAEQWLKTLPWSYADAVKKAVQVKEKDPELLEPETTGAEGTITTTAARPEVPDVCQDVLPEARKEVPDVCQEVPEVTPTKSSPKGEEVGADAGGESGEDSDEEWNYISGKENRQPNQHNKQELSEEDMESQLNPNAAEFVPVFGALDEDIAHSPTKRSELRSLEKVKVPSVKDFMNDISKRPSDLDDDFVGENDKTLNGDLNNTSTKAVFGDDSECLNATVDSSLLQNESLKSTNPFASSQVPNFVQDHFSEDFGFKPLNDSQADVFDLCSRKGGEQASPLLRESPEPGLHNGQAGSPSPLLGQVGSPSPLPGQANSPSPLPDQGPETCVDSESEDDVLVSPSDKANNLKFEENFTQRLVDEVFKAEPTHTDEVVNNPFENKISSETLDNPLSSNELSDHTQNLLETVINGDQKEIIGNEEQDVVCVSIEATPMNAEQVVLGQSPLPVEEVCSKREIQEDLICPVKEIPLFDEFLTNDHQEETHLDNGLEFNSIPGAFGNLHNIKEFVDHKEEPIFSIEKEPIFSIEKEPIFIIEKEEESHQVQNIVMNDHSVFSLEKEDISKVEQDIIKPQEDFDPFCSIKKVEEHDFQLKNDEWPHNISKTNGLDTISPEDEDSPVDFSKIDQNKPQQISEEKIFIAESNFGGLEDPICQKSSLVDTYSTFNEEVCSFKAEKEVAPVDVDLVCYRNEENEIQPEDEMSSSMIDYGEDKTLPEAQSNQLNLVQDLQFEVHEKNEADTESDSGFEIINASEASTVEMEMRIQSEKEAGAVDEKLLLDRNEAEVEEKVTNEVDEAVKKLEENLLSLVNEPVLSKGDERQLVIDDEEKRSVCQLEEKITRDFEEKIVCDQEEVTNGLEEKCMSELEEMITSDLEVKVLSELKEKVTSELEENVASGLENKTCELEEKAINKLEEKFTCELKEKVTSELEEKVTSELEEKVTSELEEKVASELEEKVTSELEEKVTSVLEEVTSELEEKVTKEMDEKAEVAVNGTTSPSAALEKDELVTAAVAATGVVTAVAVGVAAVAVAATESKVEEKKKPASPKKMEPAGKVGVKAAPAKPTITTTKSTTSTTTKAAPSAAKAPLAKTTAKPASPNTRTAPPRPGSATLKPAVTTAKPSTPTTKTMAAKTTSKPSTPTSAKPPVSSTVLKSKPAAPVAAKPTSTAAKPAAPKPAASKPALSATAKPSTTVAKKPLTPTSSTAKPLSAKPSTATVKPAVTKAPVTKAPATSTTKAPPTAPSSRPTSSKSAGTTAATKPPVSAAAKPPVSAAARVPAKPSAPARSVAAKPATPTTKTATTASKAPAAKPPPIRAPTSKAAPAATPLNKKPAAPTAIKKPAAPTDKSVKEANNKLTSVKTVIKRDKIVSKKEEIIENVEPLTQEPIISTTNGHISPIENGIPTPEIVPEVI